MDWQSCTALGIVAITLVIFLVRLARSKGKRRCGHDCGCAKGPDWKTPR